MVEPPDKDPTVVFMCLAVLAVFLFGVTLVWAAARSTQVREYQSAADRWYSACRRQGGTVVENYKGTPAHLCFSRDGRLVSSW